MLTADEGKPLWLCGLSTMATLEACAKLVMSHLRFRCACGKSYAGYGLPQAD